MHQENIPVKSLTTQLVNKSINPRKAWIWYVLTTKGVSVTGLVKLLGGTPSHQFISAVIDGKKRSRPLEDRISVALGISWDALFGPSAGIGGAA